MFKRTQFVYLGANRLERINFHETVQYLLITNCFKIHRKLLLLLLCVMGWNGMVGECQLFRCLFCVPEKICSLGALLVPSFRVWSGRDFVPIFVAAANAISVPTTPGRAGCHLESANYRPPAKWHSTLVHGGYVATRGN